MIECKDSCGDGSSRYRLKISEDEVFFGTILVGNASPAFEITLENVGWEDILFQSLSITGPFTLVRTNCPDVLKPGQKGRITVTFTPTAFGPWTGAVFIMAGRAGDHNIRLVGAAYNSNENGDDLSGIPIFLTREDLEDDANLVYPNGTYALVISDEVLANNDFYRKTGDSGEGDWGEPLGKLSTIILNGQIDLENLDNVINGAADLANPGHPAGTVTLRNGQTYKTLANILGLQTTQEQIATAQAVLARAYANNNDDTSIAGAASPADRGAKWWNTKALETKLAADAVLVQTQNIQTAVNSYLASLQLMVLSPESGYLFAFMDPNGFASLRIKNDGFGTVEVNAITLPAGSVTQANLDSTMVQLMPTLLPVESGYVLGLFDPVTGISPVRVNVAGGLELDVIPSLPAGTVTRGLMDTELSGLLPITLTPESGYVLAFVDPVTGLAPVRITTDGTFEADKLLIGDNSVRATALQLDVQRQAIGQQKDLIRTLPDMWRQRGGEVRIETALASGSRFVAVGDQPTRLLRGQNTTGASIDIRRASGLMMVGHNRRDVYDPGAYASSGTNRGQTGSGGGAVNPSTAGKVEGDYHWCGIGGQTYLGTPLYVGDLLVLDNAGAWQIQRSPGSNTTKNPNDFWDVSVAGWFHGLQLNVGDRILWMTTTPGGGLPEQQRWYRGNAADFEKNDLWYMGEFDPAGGLPASPVHGMVYQTSAAGTAGGITFANGDYAIYENAAWSKLANDPFVTYANNEFYTLRCPGGRASEWEARRTDKASGSTRVGIVFKTQTQTKQKKAQDAIHLTSDSMGGNGATWQKVTDLVAPRKCTWRANGGGTSRSILGMYTYDLLQGTLDDVGLVGLWQGQNNQPGTSSGGLQNWAQIQMVAQSFFDLALSRDQKSFFLSILGQRNMGWNGTRITASQHEGQYPGAPGFTGNSSLYRLQKWYENTFPGMVLHPHAILLSAAGTRLDPTFPGMTEQQVAAQYGILPWSFFGSTTVADVCTNYQGTWTGASLPTGVLGDYYLRIDGNGQGVGALIYYSPSNSAMVEYQIDITHMSGNGGTALANGGAGFTSGGVVIAPQIGVGPFILNNKL